MFKIKIVSVGELNEKFYIDAEREFEKRLSKFCKLEKVVVKECSHLPIAQKINAESDELKKHFVSCETAVLLSINAPLVTSESFANLIKNKRDNDSHIEFFVGGSNGVSPGFEKLFKHKISFGRITLPHCLCKIVLEEQIYRAFAILNGSPYHK